MKATQHISATDIGRAHIGSSYPCYSSVQVCYLSNIHACFLDLDSEIIASLRFLHAFINSHLYLELLFSNAYNEKNTSEFLPNWDCILFREARGKQKGEGKMTSDRW